jgi:hypothetical protein
MNSSRWMIHASRPGRLGTSRGAVLGVVGLVEVAYQRAVEGFDLLFFEESTMELAERPVALCREARIIDHREDVIGKPCCFHLSQRAEARA